jgi:hypothetical protein
MNQQSMEAYLKGSAEFAQFIMSYQTKQNEI